MVECKPQDEKSCDGEGREGVCTLMPVPIGHGEKVEPYEGSLAESSEMKWVCSVECAGDRECFTKECLNGPCRFCDLDTWSCIECEERDHEISAGTTLTYIEGCPDRNSFACEEGSCVTECYAFENGEYKYLCDPALEYCHQGR